MRILLVTGNYLPGKNGGIENYTHWLATVLLADNFQVEVAALNVNETDDYVYEGVEVNNLRGSFSAFQNVLLKGNFDICHFQEYAAFGGIELFWFKEARRYCKKIFFTFHLPYFTCWKGDFRFKGIEDCNDFSCTERCVNCILATKLHYKKSTSYNIYNKGIELLTPIISRSSRITLLKKKIKEKDAILKELINLCDQIFIYGAWFKRILNENGYHSAVIKEIAHVAKITPGSKENSDHRIKGKLLFVGRIENQKGLHLLCNAMNIISQKEIQVDVFGNIVDEKYYQRCRKIYGFNYKGSVPREELLRRFRTYDFLILPSIFTEMNSLALREAFYEELPVIVSAAKGNVDVVNEGEDGFIFEYENSADLAKVIGNAYDLKRTGWKPVFKNSLSPENDIREIISYYY